MHTWTSVCLELEFVLYTHTLWFPVVRKYSGERHCSFLMHEVALIYSTPSNRCSMPANTFVSSAFTLFCSPSLLKSRDQEKE